MAEPENEPEAPPKKGGLMSWVVIGIVGLMSAGAGFTVPLLIASGPAAEVEPAVEENNNKDSAPKYEFVQFDPTVVNLRDGKHTRFLRVKLTLQVEEDDAEEVTKFVEDNKAILKNWLLGFLSDKKIEQVNGRANQNRMRREIKNHFNEILFPGKYEKIQDILFEEFNVQ